MPTLILRRSYITKEDIHEILDAVDTICINCVEDTLTQEEISDCSARINAAGS